MQIAGISTYATSTIPLSGAAQGFMPFIRHQSLAAGHVSCRHRARVDAVTKAGAASPLHRAAHAGRMAVVKLLAEAGANCGLRDADGETPLHKAAGQGHADVAAYLMQRAPAAGQVADRHGKLPADAAVGPALSVFGVALR